MSDKANTVKDELKQLKEELHELNTDKENMNRTAEFIASVGLNCVSLLPYHGAAKRKYERLGLSYPLSDLQPPSEAEMNLFAERLERRHITVYLEGRK